MNFFKFKIRPYFFDIFGISINFSLYINIQRRGNISKLVVESLNGLYRLFSTDIFNKR